MSMTVTIPGAAPVALVQVERLAVEAHLAEETFARGGSDVEYTRAHRLLWEQVATERMLHPAPGTVASDVDRLLVWAGAMKRAGWLKVGGFAQD